MPTITLPPALSVRLEQGTGRIVIEARGVYFQGLQGDTMPERLDAWADLVIEIDPRVAVQAFGMKATTNKTRCAQFSSVGIYATASGVVTQPHLYREPAEPAKG